MKLFLVAIVVSALAISSSFASDPSPLQDICVAIDDPKSAGKYIYTHIYMYMLVLSKYVKFLPGLQRIDHIFKVWRRRYIIVYLGIFFFLSFSVG